MGWSELLEEPFPRPFPIPAYSEFMPPPYVGIKPYGERDPLLPADEWGWNVTEWEEWQELRPGLTKIGEHVFDQLDKLARGEPSQISRRLLQDNPALPPILRPPETVILPVALSRTQDDKGRVRWTLFGCSHQGAAQAFWESDRMKEEFSRIVGDPEAQVLETDVPPWVRVYDGSSRIRTLVTFRFFRDLPAPIQAAYLSGTLRLVPDPVSLIFFGVTPCPDLPWGSQLPLLSLFPRSEWSYGIRIPPSGWLDEVSDESQRRIRRTHRWQRRGRDDEDASDPQLDDPMTIALFSHEPDHLGLYGKSMSRNSQIWTEDGRALLDGPGASPEEATAAFATGGRFGYRFFYPPMRVGPRSVFWHRPLVLKRTGPDLSLSGHLTAERNGAEPIRLWPRIQSLEHAEPANRRASDQTRKDLEWRFDESPIGEPRTFERTRTREFEERYWRTIEKLSAGAYRRKNNADRPRDLEALGDFLHQSYENLFLRYGRGSITDHVFRWKEAERNLIVAIPGRNRTEAILMADHYDTAYMEDLYYPSRGGNRSRVAAAGADDNHSATAALMLAAEIFLSMELERDLWLVHLTGEEFPADCLGARALARDLVEGKFGTRIRGAFVLDMVAHNHDRDRNIFQISPGEGRGSAHLARIARRANERWNAQVSRWNEAEGRRGRPVRGTELPPLFEHAALRGEIRPEWHPKSSLYNTDGQIFSDVGIPVVLFMENYDINRAGYHDTEDTMKNIDLDYGAALVAIAIETAAEAACEKEEPKGSRTQNSEEESRRKNPE